MPRTPHRRVTETPGSASRGDGLLIGSHMSIAGGTANAFARGEEAGCAVMQIFVKNNNRWRGKPLEDEDVEAFWSERTRTGIWPVFAHNTYLVNLASDDPATRERSVACTVDELERCQRLGLPWLVIHPGAHTGSGVEQGIERMAAALVRVYEKTPDVETMILLETTAGQGTTLGRSAEELARMLDAVDAPERTAVCLDTCHVFAAGYELRDPDGYAGSIEAFEETIGLNRIKAIHVNDSKKPLGSFRDRHEHIGAGEIGVSGFRNLMRDDRFAGVPKVLETEKSDGADLRNLSLLRELAGDG